MINIKNIVLLALISSLPIVSYAAGDAAAGKSKSTTCAACHGADGISATDIWPNLAGQHASYLRKQMMEFKSGSRENPQMSPMATPLSDEDINDVSAYYASKSAKIGVAKTDGLELGERLYRAGNSKTGLSSCMACHGPNGAGIPPAKYPSLRGQHTAYTVAQLKGFKAESRNNDKNSVMRSIAGKMTNAEIEAVANYIQGLH